MNWIEEAGDSPAFRSSADAFLLTVFQLGLTFSRTFRAVVIEHREKYTSVNALREMGSKIPYMST